jgi:hypothetical protein
MASGWTSPGKGKALEKEKKENMLEDSLGMAGGGTSLVTGKRKASLEFAS